MCHIGGLEDVGKRKLLIILGFELRPLVRPARSQPLYRLRYPGSPHKIGIYFNELSKSLEQYILKFSI
jgi:hypothetical protein